MLEIIKSQRFQDEYKLYRNRIDKITTAEVQSQADILLKTLVSEVKKLDQQHQEMFAGNQVPTGLGDVRSGITGIRKKLDTLLKDWESRNTAG